MARCRARSIGARRLLAVRRKAWSYGTAASRCAGVDVGKNAHLRTAGIGELLPAVAVPGSSAFRSLPAGGREGLRG